MKFKIGDMVACIDMGNSWYGYVFIITKAYTKNDVPLYLCECCVDGSEVWFSEEKIRLVKEISEKKENDKKKVFENNRDKILGGLFLNDFFKFMSGKFKGCYGIVCSCTANAINCIAFKEDPEEKVFCMVFSDAIPYPMFSIEDASTKIKKLSGKTIFEED